MPNKTLFKRMRTLRDSISNKLSPKGPTPAMPSNTIAMTQLSIHDDDDGNTVHPEEEDEKLEEVETKQENEYKMQDKEEKPTFPTLFVMASKVSSTLSMVWFAHT